MDMKDKQTILKYRQAMPLDIKVRMTQQRIEQWYNHWGGDVYVAFSGGKDSTVLLRLVRELYPDVPAVFVNTGLQFPEVRRFALNKENIVEIRPKMGFREVIEKHGYPIVGKKVAHLLEDLQNPTEKNAATCHLYNTGWTLSGKHQPDFKLADKWRFLIDAPFKISDRCCDVMKKNPAKGYERESGRHPIVGSMVEDSAVRRYRYLQLGCNAFETRNPRSMPLGFWTEQDVLQYIVQEGIEIASVYGEVVKDKMWRTTGEHNTGCVFCAFGLQYDGVPNRFQRLKMTHPKLHRYCMDNLGMREVLEFLGEEWE